MRKCECVASCIIAFICTLGWYRILGQNLRAASALDKSSRRGEVAHTSIETGQLEAQGSTGVSSKPIERGIVDGDGHFQATGEDEHTTVNRINEKEVKDIEKDTSVSHSKDNETIEDAPAETSKEDDLIELHANASSSTPAYTMVENQGRKETSERPVPLILESGSYWPGFTAAARKPFRNPCPGRKFHGPIVGSGPLRFFIYPLPQDLIHASDINKLDKTTQMNRAFEPAVHKVMANHAARTLDPEEASFFLIPAHLSCVANVWLSQSGGGGVCPPCNALEKKIIDFMEKFGKYWSRNGGVDHIVSSFTCPRPNDKIPFHRLWPRGEPLRCAPIELCLRTKSRESADEFRSVKVPYHVPDSDYADLTAPRTKDISVYFAGSYLAILGNKRQPIVDALPKIPGGVSYVFDRKLFNKWPTEKQNEVLSAMSHNYSRALFIAVPQGDTTVESRRTYQAIANGCIPIVLSGKFGPNLPEALDWSEFAVSFDLDVLFEKQEKSGLPKQEFERKHAKHLEERIQKFIKGMSSVTDAQIKHLREGLAKNQDLLRYGDDGKGGLGKSILKALERRREAFKR